MNTSIVAEISGNHNGSLDNALEIVRSVAGTGIQYLKLQTYTPDTITLPMRGGLFEVSADHQLWAKKNLYDLYSEAYTPWDWHKPIFDAAKSYGLTPFSTPFDETAVDFLEELDVPIYKIASLEIVDLPLIEKVAKTGKPMIISTGTATLGEIEEAVSTAKKSGCRDLSLMLCTSSYPAKLEDCNLSRIPILRSIFKVPVGYSDHTLGSTASMTAVALGATIIEKHVALSIAGKGVDSDFSLDLSDAREFVRRIAEVEAVIGSSDTWRSNSESESLRHRPSIYITKDVKAGELATSQNIATLRPSGGLEPRHFGSLVGRKFTRDISFGTATNWQMFGD
jgi:N-acetylneuraminate synthase